MPVRIEVGPRDLAAGTVTLVRRDVAGEKSHRAARRTWPPGGRTSREIQSSLYQQALDRREACTVDAAGLAEVREAAQTGFARVPWDAIRDAEADLAADALTVRCLQRRRRRHPRSSAEPGLVATVAKAY